ncbi:MAG: excinuclease ABC subunit UvrC [Acutalibacteraceae bacterium]
MAQSAETNEERIKRLRKKAMALPLEPGVYIMKNAKHEIIYIGKAKMLKNRVSQYFGSDRNHSEKVRRMVLNVQDFDYIITDSEFEALVLECSLIKQNQPKYNILLKDDKGYCYIRVSPKPWRRIEQVMQTQEDGAEYIGPYMSSWYVRNAVDEACKIFGLPTCTKVFPRDFRKGRPCLNYHIKQCCALCTGKIRLEDYEERVDAALEFLRDGNSVSVKTMTEKMNQAAEMLDFELAAKLRDRIQAVKKTRERQKVVAYKVEEQDVIALMTEGKDGCFAVLRFSGGRLVDKEDFLISDIGDAAQARKEFLEQYYSMRQNVPPIVLLDGAVEDQEILEAWLTKQAGRKVRFLFPQKGEQEHLLEMCRNNAAEKLAQSRGYWGSELTALDELAKVLGLEKVPEFIESYDISNLMGSENVAGMVVFRNGRPYKSAYRRFKIKGFVGQDDYASMREVLERRMDEYEKNKDSGEGFGRLPDLILLDGGKGQVAAVRGVLRERGIDIPLFGMVKDNKHRTRAVTDEGKEIAIQSKRKVFTLLSNLQDEVHRFAITYHRAARSKNAFSSSLTDIPLIGKERAKNLLTCFKTISRIREAEVEELLHAKGMNQAAAQAVYDYYHKEQSETEV